MESSFSRNMLVTEQFELEFVFPISKTIYVGNVYIVLLEIPRKSSEVDNLYGVDNKGKIIWKVESVQKAFGLVNSTPYIAVNVVSEEVVSVTNFYGMRFYVRVADGTLFDKENLRW